MRFLVGIGVAALVALAVPVAPAGAATVPFTEDFAAGDAAWRGNPNTVGSLDWSSEGYVSEVFSFVSLTPASQGPVLFRGPNDSTYAGNWLTDGVLEVHFSVRHDAPVPVTFFARFPSPFGFPGAIAVSFAPVVASSEWTELVFTIDPSNPQFIGFEGSDFNTVFSNIGRVQLGVSVPEGLAGVDTNVTFDLASVSLVPEAGGLGALALAACGALFALRARHSLRALPARTGKGA